MNKKLLFEIEILNNRILELEKFNKSLVHTVENITDGFYSLDKNWNYIYLNDIALKSVNKTLEELIGKNIWDTFPEIKAHPFYDAFHEAMEKQEIIEIEGYYPPLEKWLNVRICPSNDFLSVFFTEKNESEKVLIEADQKLESEKQKTYSLFMNAPFIVAMTSGPEHIYKFVNPEYKKIVGEKDYIGKPVRVFLIYWIMCLHQVNHL